MTGIASAGQPPVPAIRTDEVPEAARGAGSEDGTPFADLLAETRAGRDETIRAEAQAHRAEEHQRREAAIERDAASREVPPADPSLAHTDPNLQRPAAEGREWTTASSQNEPAGATPHGPKSQPTATTDNQEDGADGPTDDPSPARRTTSPTNPAGATGDTAGEIEGAGVLATPNAAPATGTGTGTTTQTTVAAVRGAAASQSVTNPQLTSQNQTAAAESNRAVRPQATTAGYRSTRPSALKMTEQARESVFRQIAMHLNKDGTGDMRVWLQPHDLGRIDVKVAIGEGNQARLWIRTERPELGAMLEQHRGQLERALRDQGLEISGSDIDYDADFASSEGSQPDPGAQSEHAPHFGGAHAPTTDPAESEPTETIRFATTDGFDFWA